MTDNDWFLSLISELDLKNIGDKSRLESIRTYLNQGKELYQTDKNYLITKYAELQKVQQDAPKIMQEPTPTTDQTNIQEPTDVKDDDIGELKDQIKNLNEKVKKFEKLEENRIKDQQITFREKSLSTTLILSLVLGLIGIQGIGHMYANRIGKGVAILIISLILFGVGLATWPGGGILLVIYFGIFIWQIFDSRKCCYNYNTKLRNSIRRQS